MRKMFRESVATLLDKDKEDLILKILEFRDILMHHPNISKYYITKYNKHFGITKKYQ